jgi:hypothetical protein
MRIAAFAAATPPLRKNATQLTWREEMRSTARKQHGEGRYD